MTENRPLPGEASNRAPIVHDLTVVGGKRLRARAWQGSGLPLVLLHGFLDSSQGWADLATATPRSCYALDLPGFGGSEAPEWPRITAYANSVRDAMAALGVERAILVGHSFGGAVATRLAERDPGSVASLVLLAPVGFGPITLAGLAGLPVVRDLLAAALPLALVNPLLSGAGYAAAIARRRLPPAELLSRMAATSLGRRAGIRDALAALAVLNRPEKLFGERIPYYGPVTAVWGDGDVLVPARHRERLRRVLPQAEVSVWRGVAHHPQAEAPKRLAALVEEVCCAAEQSPFAAGGALKATRAPASSRTSALRRRARVELRANATAPPLDPDPR